MRISLVAIAVAALSGSATAGTLGITGAEFRLGTAALHSGTAEAILGPVTKTDPAPTLFLGFAAVDVAITPAHGVQLDAVLEDGPVGAIGRIGGHLFMTPEDAHKYGLYGALADLDGKAVTWGEFGVEGILALAPGTSLELRGGLGYGTGGLDWVTAGAALTRTRGAVTYRVAATLTEFDETALHSFATEVTIGADLRLAERLSTFAEATYARLDGAGAAPQTTYRAGLALTFGALGGASPKTQLFRATDPVAQLVRRGYY